MSIYRSNNLPYYEMTRNYGNFSYHIELLAVAGSFVDAVRAAIARTGIVIFGIAIS